MLTGRLLETRAVLLQVMVVGFTGSDVLWRQFGGRFVFRFGEKKDS